MTGAVTLEREARLAAEPYPVQVASISVVIPTCDRPDYLREAIASVQAQTLRPSEILVIDNGTEPLDGAVLPQGVSLHRIPARVGPSRARNVGAGVATGDFLAFLDDDDWWAPQFLEAALQAIQEQRVRCVYGQKCRITHAGPEPYPPPTAEMLTVETLLRRNRGTGGDNLLIDRELYLKVGGFDERLLLSEDRALALEILLAGERIGIAPKAELLVRVHETGRLREHGIRKLGFIRKYRRLYSVAGFTAAYGRVLLASLAGWLGGTARQFNKGVQS